MNSPQMGWVSVNFDHPELGKFTASARYALMGDGTLYVAEIHLDGLAPFGERRDLREEDEAWIREKLGKCAAKEQLVAPGWAGGEALQAVRDRMRAEGKNPDALLVLEPKKDGPP